MAITKISIEQMLGLVTVELKGHKVEIAEMIRQTMNNNNEMAEALLNGVGRYLRDNRNFVSEFRLMADI